ncbi:MAG: hypothetical protein P1P86_14800 [Bacteroidales bacterium]|nr:hypothetical protein [Bacteroidales bacterium]
MKNLVFLLFLSISAVAYSQVITEEELTLMLVSAQEKCAGAHESVVLRSNEEFAKTIWGKKIRFNNAHINRFFSHSAGEKVSAGVDLFKSNPKDWVYSFDQQEAAELFKGNGVGVTESYNTLWIKARQNILHAEVEKEGRKLTLELYCPHDSFLELLRIGKTQSIEFLITGYKGSTTFNSHIYGVLTDVHAEKQVLTCENGHEFDKALGYKFCPTCGKPLE